MEALSSTWGDGFRACIQARVDQRILYEKKTYGEAVCLLLILWFVFLPGTPNAGTNLRHVLPSCSDVSPEEQIKGRVGEPLLKNLVKLLGGPDNPCARPLLLCINNWKVVCARVPQPLQKMLRITSLRHAEANVSQWTEAAK